MQQCLVNTMVDSVFPCIITVACYYQVNVTMWDDSKTADWEQNGRRRAGWMASPQGDKEQSREYRYISMVALDDQLIHF